MKILFFDTETTGTPKNYRAPLTDFDNWPRLVQLAWIQVDGDDLAVMKSFDTLIKPEGFEIPQEAIAIHGITTERASLEGMKLKDALAMFSLALANCDMIVGHNISFDRNIIGSEMLRMGFEDSLHGKPRICTMNAGTNFCQLPGKYGYKWPKLSELHEKLFKEPFESAHNAKADIYATAKCFFAMCQRGIISEEMIQVALGNMTKAKVEGF